MKKEPEKDTSFTNTQRIKGKPFRKRVKNNLLERDENGSVCLTLGYFDKNQILARCVWRSKVLESIKKNSYFARLKK